MPKRQSSVLIVNQSSWIVFAQVLSRSPAHASLEDTLQFAGSVKPKSVSNSGQSVSGAGGQLAPVKFCTVFALMLFRFPTDGENDEHGPDGLTEYEPELTAKL